MNRPIKFRAWDADKQAMRHSSRHRHVVPAGGIIHEIVDTPNDRGYLDTVIEDMFNGIAMQFTGLKDKNGIEVYEGDIVQDQHYAYTVEWSEAQAKFVLGFPFHDSVVIGNIYQNPELLEKTL